jgi:hypothetical protein
VVPGTEPRAQLSRDLDGTRLADGGRTAAAQRGNDFRAQPPETDFLPLVAHELRKSPAVIRRAGQVEGSAPYG